MSDDPVMINGDAVVQDLDDLVADRDALREQAEAYRLHVNDASRMIDDLEAQRDMLRAYARHLELIVGDTPNAETVIDRLQTEYGVAELLDAERSSR